MVGTPAETVGRWRSMMAARGAAWRYCWGMIRSAPVRNAPYGVPHALAWNIGTTGSSVSRPETSLTSGSAATSECSTSDRCEYTTPLGRPVVPDV